MFSVALVLIALQGPAPAQAADLDARLEEARKRVGDATRPVDQRVAIALEEAAAIDREGQASATTEGRRAWADAAIGLLDGFNAREPRHAFATPVALQAAVFAWGDGRRDLDAWRIAPGDLDLKAHASARLDAAVARIERIEPALSGADPSVAQNARFRLAQALADRAALDDPGSTGGRDRLKRALGALEPVPSEPSLVGFARLLRAEVDAGLGEFEAAEKELGLAASAKYPPPPGALAEARAEILIGKRRYRDALAAVDKAGLDDVARAALAVRVLLAHRANASAGSERREAEADAFARAKALRGSPRPEARAALADLARVIDAPTSSADPDAWETLADAALARGDSARAARLALEGADLQGRRRLPEEAGRLRLRAGAILYAAGDDFGADGAFGLVWDDPKSGPSRPKAGTLRALARGRALANKAPGATRSAYVASLRDLIAAYPDDPASGEARWRLGLSEREDGRLGEAVALWTKVPPGHPRGLAARLAIADDHLRRVDEARVVDDPARSREAHTQAAAFLKAATAAVPETAPGDAFDLDLATARLDLTPVVGRPELARALCDRLAHQGASEAQHARARSLRIVALAMTGRHAEAEREALDEAPRAPIDDLLLAARLLDRAAGEAESDSARARSGIVLRVLLEGMAPRAGSMPDDRAAEFRLRTIRALIFAGQPASARRLLSGPTSPEPTALDPGGLRDLADALNRLDAPGLAVDVERLRLRALKPGSPPWIEARYALALALHRSQKPREAIKLIDATAILHPELGGDRLREKFERLRRRASPE